MPFFTRLRASEPPFFEWAKKHGPKKAHPTAVVSGHPALRLRKAAPGFADSTSVCWQQTGSHPCEPPFGHFLHIFATAQGPHSLRILRSQDEARAQRKQQQRPAICSFILLPPAGEGPEGG